MNSLLWLVNETEIPATYGGPRYDVTHLLLKSCCLYINDSWWFILLFDSSGSSGMQLHCYLLFVVNNLQIYTILWHCSPSSIRRSNPCCSFIVLVNKEVKPVYYLSPLTLLMAHVILSRTQKLVTDTIKPPGKCLLKKLKAIIFYTSWLLFATATYCLLKRCRFKVKYDRLVWLPL